jgi:hypothetical protein
MATKRFRPLDLSKIRTYPLEKRKSKVQSTLLSKRYDKGGTVDSFLRGLPDILAAKTLKEVARRIVEIHRRRKTVLFGMGAHVIKVGLSPLIIDFMEKGIVNAVAMNGAGIVHDFELAFLGQTSEDVAASLADGSFGMAEETGTFLNEAIQRGAASGIGIGAAVGQAILDDRLPHRRLSILAAGARLGVPITVHVGVGTDIIHMHPRADGTSIGRGSLADFRTLAAVVATLNGGIYLNVGSAVVLPEVFLKALSLARNLGHKVDNLTTLNMDFIAHYRPLTNVVSRPTMGNSKGYHLTGHHEIMVPLLFAAVREYLK